MASATITARVPEPGTVTYWASGRGGCVFYGGSAGRKVTSPDESLLRLIQNVRRQERRRLRAIELRY